MYVRWSLCFKTTYLASNMWSSIEVGLKMKAHWSYIRVISMVGSVKISGKSYLGPYKDVLGLAKAHPNIVPICAIIQVNQPNNIIVYFVLSWGDCPVYGTKYGGQMIPSAGQLRLFKLTGLLQTGLYGVGSYCWNLLVLKHWKYSYLGFGTAQKWS